MAPRSRIALAEAQKELQRIDERLNERTLLIGGLAVQQYCPTRRSRDIDLVADDDTIISLIDALYPSSEWDVEDVNRDAYRPAYVITHKFSTERPTVYFGPKVMERGSYPPLEWDFMSADSVAFRFRDVELNRIVVPACEMLCVSKVLSFINRIEKAPVKAKQDLRDIVDLSNLNQFRLGKFFNSLRQLDLQERVQKEFSARLTDFAAVFEDSNLFRIGELFFSPLRVELDAVAVKGVHDELKNVEREQTDVETAQEPAQDSEPDSVAKSQYTAEEYATGLHSEKLALTYAECAAAAARDGRVEDARSEFALALDLTDNLHVLYLAYEFYDRTGDFPAACSALERALAICDPDRDSDRIAAIYGNLGLIRLTQGDLDGAKEMHLKSLAICKKLGKQDGIATNYGNLGRIFQTRGDLHRAELMYRMALKTDEENGREKGIAFRCGNLGRLFVDLNDLVKAEEMFERARELMENYKNQEGIADAYGNLGVVYRKRKDFAKAKEWHRKSLAICERLDYQTALAANWGNLGVLHLEQGDLDQAEEMFGKALEIELRLRRQEGVANAYRELGRVAKARGNLSSTACAMWRSARNIYARVGIFHEAIAMQDAIEEVEDEFDGLK